MKSVLLEFISTDTKTIIFVIRQDWQERGIADSEPLVFEASISEEEIVACVGEIRGLYKEWEAQGYSPDYIKRIDLAKRTGFYAIGEALFSDALMEMIEGYELIYFVPFSALHHLPLHAMRYKQEEIIDLYACSYLPSASVLQFTNQKKQRPKSFAIKGVGVDSLNKKSKFFKGEVSELQKLTHDALRVELYKDANKEEFLSGNEAFNILHCSAHGYFAVDEPLDSSIMLFIPDSDRPQSLEELEKQMSNPNSPLKQSAVSVHDLIERLDSSFELVFLSACVSGENKNEAGDELIGLSRGLFYAGTKSMILALFTVFKEKTGKRNSPTHIAQFYRLWIEEGQSKAKAFQNYIKILKQDAKHPFEWFAYILIGNPY